MKKLLLFALAIVPSVMADPPVALNNFKLSLDPATSGILAYNFNNDRIEAVATLSGLTLSTGAGPTFPITLTATGGGGGVTAPVTLTIAGVSNAVVTDALSLVNSTAATTGVRQQYSPDLRFKGSGWKTTATAGPMDTEWRIYNPVFTDAATPQSYLYIESQTNGGVSPGAAWTQRVGIWDGEPGGFGAWLFTANLKVQGTGGKGVLELATQSAGPVPNPPSNSNWLYSNSAGHFVWKDSAGTTHDPQDAANITSGTVGTARLGSGTALTTTFLRGDSSWQTVPAPAFTDITGSVAATQMPALTGDTTSVAGAVATVTHAMSQDAALSGVVSDTLATGTTVNWSPTGLATASFIKVTGNSSGTSAASGLQGGTTGRIITIQNVGAFNVTLLNEGTGSTAGNRFHLLHDTVIPPEGMVVLQYDNDATTKRWRASVNHIHDGADITSGTLPGARMPALSGDVTMSAGSTTTAITAGAVSLADMANMATASLIYRKTAGTGTPEVNTLATLKTDLALPTFPSGTIVGTTDTQTLTNKRINPRVDSSTSAGATTWAPNADTTDVFELAGALTAAVTTISNPSGTPVEAQKLMFRIKSDGSAHALTWSGSQWRASGASGAPALPATTTASKNIVIGFMWNSTDSKWDLLAVQDGY